MASADAAVMMHVASGGADVILLQSDDHVPPLVPGLDVPVSFGDLLEREASANDRRKLSHLSQTREERQVFHALGCRPGR